MISNLLILPNQVKISHLFSFIYKQVATEVWKLEKTFYSAAIFYMTSNVYSLSKISVISTAKTHARPRQTSRIDFFVEKVNG